MILGEPVPEGQPGQQVLPEGTSGWHLTVSRTQGTLHTWLHGSVMKIQF